MIRYRRKRIFALGALFVTFVIYSIIPQRDEDLMLQPVSIDSEPPLKILVLSYNRSRSLAQCLESLQSLELDGSEGTIEIWIDRSQENVVDQDVVKTARNFKWKHGNVSVHIQEEHVGIYGQWIRTWKPKEGSREIAIILEDDIDLSPYAFRWLKEAHNHYDREKDVAGYGLSDIEIPLNFYKEFLRTSSDEVVFKFARFSTFGFSPKASVWRQFQKWYNQKSKDLTFKPYTKSDALFTKWFRIFERKKSSKSMWSIWFIRFCNEEKLYTVYANTHEYLTKRVPGINNGTSLAYHRREAGLHFVTSHTRPSKDFVLQKWYPDLVKFPSNIPVYNIPPAPPKKAIKVLRRIVSKKVAKTRNIIKS